MKTKKILPVIALIAVISIGTAASAHAESSQVSVSANVQAQSGEDRAPQGQGGIKGVWNSMFHGDANENRNGNENDEQEHSKGIMGTVTAISGNTITISSKSWKDNVTTATTYTIDVTNAKVEKAGAASTTSAIVIGDNIVVEGTITGTSIIATQIHDGMPKDDHSKDGAMLSGNGQPIIGGTVTAVAGNTITITNKSAVSYTIDATNAKFNKDGVTTATISNIAVGDNLLAQGSINGTAIVATSIVDHGTVAPGNKEAPHGFFIRIGNFFSRIFGFGK